MGIGIGPLPTAFAALAYTALASTITEAAIACLRIFPNSYVD
jgi:hypothetical protein